LIAITTPLFDGPASAPAPPATQDGDGGAPRTGAQSPGISGHGTPGRGGRRAGPTPLFAGLADEGVTDGAD
jgi:hypothetical protein